ncbi:putative ancient conserved domain protein 2 [Monocercomonoides exilis]|uniref:putative ancient conserved domain protein 2 n=1 Tax=Monocercomonoides exilis TaxID=2049356 RepID=UPI00355A0427|nr:putative ancient conserved domain protein 2 [Monocercomonoides exilis]|eukprot:MONOS_5344.1-p1 / transcript=MONOS_5344.1 / gene=MONOS_5344 / organism=Monocercomonoides_exilis_PA203 / gene_product=ancient conserved domain protein 2 / transcript_product=ancient conserved domain protein 2 / location=Mono_scaffold00154:59584-63197(-) / protein_length=1036 / sequence_SO=supercontig / SO=protein_coding / is_pseudo=false
MVGTTGSNVLGSTSFEPAYLVLEVLGALLLLSISAMFSCLGTDIFGKDKTHLRMMLDTGNEKEQKYARKILKIRKHGNVLRVSIVLGNILGKVSGAVLIGLALEHWTSVFVSWIALSFVGEIIPQAVYTRQGKGIAMYLSWFCIVWMFVVGIISYPVGKLIDYINGSDAGIRYSKDQLKKLIEMHTNDPNQEISVKSEAEETDLGFFKKTAKDIMTSIEKVVMIEADLPLSPKLNLFVLSSGHTKIPVFEADQNAILGYVETNDVVLLDCSKENRISTYFTRLGKSCISVDADASVLEVLFEMKAKRANMCVVYRVNAEGDGDPFYENLGIITREDIDREIVGDEENDENKENKSEFERESRLEMEKRMKVYKQTKDKSEEGAECKENIIKNQGSSGEENEKTGKVLQKMSCINYENCDENETGNNNEKGCESNQQNEDEKKMKISERKVGKIQKMEEMPQSDEENAGKEGKSSEDKIKKKEIEANLMMISEPFLHNHSLLLQEDNQQTQRKDKHSSNEFEETSHFNSSLCDPPSTESANAQPLPPSDLSSTSADDATSSSPSFLLSVSSQSPIHSTTSPSSCHLSQTSKPETLMTQSLSFTSSPPSSSSSSLSSSSSSVSFEANSNDLFPKQLVKHHKRHRQWINCQSFLEESLCSLVNFLRSSFPEFASWDRKYVAALIRASECYEIPGWMGSRKGAVCSLLCNDETLSIQNNISEIVNKTHLPCCLSSSSSSSSSWSSSSLSSISSENTEKAETFASAISAINNDNSTLIHAQATDDEDKSQSYPLSYHFSHEKSFSSCSHKNLPELCANYVPPVCKACTQGDSHPDLIIVINGRFLLIHQHSGSSSDAPSVVEEIRKPFTVINAECFFTSTNLSEIHKRESADSDERYKETTKQHITEENEVNCQCNDEGEHQKKFGNEETEHFMNGKINAEMNLNEKPSFSVGSLEIFSDENASGSFSKLRNKASESRALFLKLCGCYDSEISPFQIVPATAVSIDGHAKVVLIRKDEFKRIKFIMELEREKRREIKFGEE